MVVQDYLQYFEVTSLDRDATINIKLPTETLHYRVYLDSEIETTVAFLYNPVGRNDKIFTILDIHDPNSFVLDVVYYDANGCFPEVESKGDLLKVIIALDKECIKKFGDKRAASESKSKPTSESNLFSKEKRKRRYQLDFNIH